MSVGKVSHNHSCADHHTHTSTTPKTTASAIDEGIWGSLGMLPPILYPRNGPEAREATLIGPMGVLAIPTGYRCDLSNYSNTTVEDVKTYIM